MKFNQFIQIAAVLFFSINFSFAQEFSADTYYRLTTKWQGEDKSLDIINDGKDSKTPILRPSTMQTGQQWKITKVGADTYTLTTKFTGPDKKLDCIQGPNQNRPVLNKSKYSGSAWKITSVGGGYYKITNSWLSDRSLDIINDGKNDKIQVAKTGNYTGQMWKITDLFPTKNHLNADETLKAGERLTSANGKYILRMQADDGNLCVYNYADGKQGRFVWGSMKYGFKNSKLVMQGDGNLVVYDGKNDAKWSSQTHPYYNAKFRKSSNKPVKLVLENDGSLKLYTAAGAVIWSNKDKTAAKSKAAKY